MSKELYQKRLRAVRAAMERLGVEAMFLSPSSNLEYLTGERRRRPSLAHFLWPGGWVNGAWITATRDPFITCPRAAASYELENAEGWEVRVLADDADPRAFLSGITRELGLAGKRVAVENRAWGEFVLELLRAEPTIEGVVASDIMDGVRAIKGPEELAALARAGEITDRAFGEVVKHMRLGMTERDLVGEVDHQLRAQGSEPAFSIGVLAWGERFPRKSEDREKLVPDPIGPGTSVYFDFGAFHGGYCADFSRMVHMGEPSGEYRRAYQVVLEAQEAARAAMAAGRITAEGLYDVAYRVMAEAGYGAFSPDRLGHGIGMDAHECPSLFTGDRTLLQEGMVCTLEPGILKGPVMAQVEDLAVVRPQGGELLTRFTKELLVVD